MSDLFNIYEDSFNILITRIKKVTLALDNLSKEKTEQALFEANQNINEAESHLKRMELECDYNYYDKNKEPLLIKVGNYRKEFQDTKIKLFNLQGQYITKKSQDIKFANINDNLIENEETFENQIEKLEASKRKIFTIEKNSNNLSQHLNENTSKIQNIIDKSIEFDNNLNNNDEVIDKMNKKYLKNKRMLIFGVILILIILVLVYFLKRM